MLVKVGDSPNLQPLDLACNTADEGLFSNISAATRRGLPEVRNLPANDQIAVICGGGSSLAGTLESVRILQSQGAKVFALNNAAKFLVEHGIRPDAQILLDPRAQNAQFVHKRWARELYLASQAHPDVYLTAIKYGNDVRIFHAHIDGLDKAVSRTRFERALLMLHNLTGWRWAGLAARKPVTLNGGITVGLTGMCLVHTLGHRKIHLFGFDSCYGEKGESHAYPQPMNAEDERVTVSLANKSFECSVAMSGQAHSFMHIHEVLRHDGSEIVVHGEGLIPHLWRDWKREHTQRVLTAVYELGLSPPTYDFIAFLVEAERYRIEKKYDLIDIVFQPGPIGGFRADDLPPDTVTRKAMLWRICVGAARLLPSVRNILTLAERARIDGDAFPEGYTEQTPKSHYGIYYLRNATPMLRASEHARRWQKQHYPRRYATITMRESHYWPERNSHRAEWQKVAWWLTKQGIEPVFVEDTDRATDAISFDIDLRAALYEGAEINLGVANGPMVLLPFLGARYLVFNVGQVMTKSTTPDFLKSHGYTEEEGMGGNGRMVWKPDTAENIIAELQEFKSNVIPLKEKTS